MTATLTSPKELHKMTLAAGEWTDEVLAVLPRQRALEPATAIAHADAGANGRGVYYLSGANGRGQHTTIRV